ncbi:MAG: thioredoxin family protein [Chloroflexi bacterium]|nr:thioredoxin family protein [Anaerolineaceae bacterium]NMB90384.1 thioredoxin family protein [Chloroflexota bacterium]
MNLAEFEARIKNNPQPLILDLWAPWCAPCRAMEPAFKQVSQKYAGQVEVLKINADDSAEVLRSLGVMGIPTVVAFAGGKEIVRRTGMQSAEALDILFDAALHQRKPAITPPAPMERLLRSAAGLALLGLGWFNGPSYLLLGLGAVILFSAFYDRCPIYRAIVPYLTARLQRQRQ